MKRIIQLIIAFSVLPGTMLVAQTGGLPANPEPGKCYIKCVTPAEFTTEDVKIMTSPAYTRLEVIPATYKTVTEKVLIKEASKKYTFTPAEFEVVDVPYVSKEGRTDYKVIPATLGDDSERIMTYPKTSGFEFSAIPCPDPDRKDCQALCFKEYPARYTKVDKKVLATAAKTEPVPVPEVKTSYKKRVVKTPAKYEVIEIPAEYDEITRKVIDQPATTKTIEIPAEYSVITKTVMTKASKVEEWVPVDCDLLSPNIIPIYWDFNSAVLTPEAKKVARNTILKVLKEQPKVTVEVGSHTDARGNDAYNRALSQRRADAIRTYLISQGVNGDRIISKGWGETKLLNNCENDVKCSEAQHQENRRTDFRVINHGK